MNTPRSPWKTARFGVLALLAIGACNDPGDPIDAPDTAGTPGADAQAPEELALPPRPSVPAAVPPSVPPSVPTEVAPEAPVPEMTQDELFAEVSRRVPGFAGLFLDARGEPTLLTTDPVDAGPVALDPTTPVVPGGGLSAGNGATLVPAGPRAAMAAAVRAAFGAGRVPEAIDARLASGSVRLVHAEHSFLELKRWSDLATPRLLSLRGVFATDIGDAENRLVVSVTRPEAGIDVEAELARLGIPVGAVIVRVGEAPVMAATVRDRVRPLVGGLQIAFGSSLCTLGFNAVRGGVAGFVTNSHCSNTQGGTEGTLYYQSTVASDTRVGTESADPAYFVNGVCPVGRRCRYSDSLFVRRDSGVAASQGLKAVLSTASLDILGTDRIVSEASSTVVGETLNKVGRTTGRSWGNVSRTCVTTSVNNPDGTDSGVTLICQHIVSASSAGGDSGSPVYDILGQGDLRLHGILWGTSPGSFWFSPISAVQRSAELGSVTTCAAGFTC